MLSKAVTRREIDEVRTTYVAGEGRKAEKDDMALLNWVSAKTGRSFHFTDD